MRVTDVQAEKLIEKLQLLAADGVDDMPTMMKVIKNWGRESSSFSEIINEDGKYQKYCPTCDKSYTIWKCRFPVLMIRALRILHDYGQPMSVRQIQECLPTNWDERGQFTKLRYWGLIREAGNDSRASLYRITEDAGMFFAKVKKVREWLWIFDDQVVEAPMEETNGSPLLITELKHSRIPLEDIIDESVSAFVNPPVPAEQTLLV